MAQVVEILPHGSEGPLQPALSIADDPLTQETRGRLNIKMSSYQYRDPHVKDKTVSRPSYL